jgi:hypothetical protein
MLVPTNRFILPLKLTKTTLPPATLPPFAPFLALELPIRAKSVNPACQFDVRSSKTELDDEFDPRSSKVALDTPTSKVEREFDP